MNSKIHFQNKLNETNDLPEMTMTLTRNKKRFLDQTERTSGPILWNSSYQNLKLSKTVKHFPNQLKNYLISQYQLFWFGAKIYFWALFCCVRDFFSLNVFICSFYLPRWLEVYTVVHIFVLDFFVLGCDHLWPLGLLIISP